jgi:hypothetical protein
MFFYLQNGCSFKNEPFARLGAFGPYRSRAERPTSGFGSTVESGLPLSGGREAKSCAVPPWSGLPTNAWE